MKSAFNFTLNIKSLFTILSRVEKLGEVSPQTPKGAFATVQFYTIGAALHFSKSPSGDLGVNLNHDFSKIFKINKIQAMVGATLCA